MKKEKYQRIACKFDWFNSCKQGIATVTRDKIEAILGEGSDDEWYGIFTNSLDEETRVCAWSHNHSLDRSNTVSIYAQNKMLLGAFKNFLEKP